MRLSERRATNIGLLYPKVRNNIGGDIPVDVPPTKILGGCVPGIPGGVDASARYLRDQFSPGPVNFSFFLVLLAYTAHERLCDDALYKSSINTHTDIDI